MLLERDDPQALGSHESPGIRFERAGEQAEEGGLAAPIGPEQAQALTGTQVQVEIGDEGLSPERLADATAHHQLFRFPAGGCEFDTGRGPP